MNKLMALFASLGLIYCGAMYIQIQNFLLEQEPDKRKKIVDETFMAIIAIGASGGILAGITVLVKNGMRPIPGINVKPIK